MGWNEYDPKMSSMLNVVSDCTPPHTPEKKNINNSIDDFIWERQFRYFFAKELGGRLLQKLQHVFKMNEMISHVNNDRMLHSRCSYFTSAG